MLGTVPVQARGFLGGLMQRERYERVRTGLMLTRLVDPALEHAPDGFAGQNEAMGARVPYVARGPGGI
jgi:hypothetical protein